MKSVVVNGVRLGYRESGDPAGVPAVLLHGSGSSARTWDRFTPRLTAAGYRTLAVDLRGHATSDRSRDYTLRSIGDDVVGLLETLDLRDTVLIGHSVGGYAALDAARRTPERIAGLVLEDLAAPPRERTRSAKGVSPRQVLTGVAGILTVRRDYDLRALASLLRQLTRPDARWWEDLAGVRHPALLLSGGPASCIPPRRLAEVASLLPAARLTTIPVGHRVHSLAPDRFATEVLAFLDVMRCGSYEAA
ncbi:alpha/beta hydrolase [Paractinoplanes ferrugineus]|uniref:Alpha/beta hydrolase n=1 Tax=Paractinoplanes ferrugineus TaxID=113564 RepID=A0A919J151_9ACTN|nr:alpha/beta hydrolase [Actinoplanes ferrugineus]GIE10524.1 alpha/beta hydrolase [Actinoplanes ferrugineus]